MSGIFGVVRLPGATVFDAELAPMAETLKHRGPDGISYSARNNVGLGHCILHSTPESLNEVLPIRDEVSGLTITADARIDNREQLLNDIPVRTTNSQPITDSQLILQAYRKWGESCVDHLLGDFVFAIWDERAQALFVARDHMGCKPFYFHCRDGLFVFASSAMAVASLPDVNATLNEARVADFLVEELEGINKTCSWYNGVSRMPPAQCGYFRNNTFQYRQYWTLQPADLSHLKTDDDYLQAFTEVYTEAVRCRLRCQTEPASMLSGGLDSSTIVALARDILVVEGELPLRSYSGISEQEFNCSETRSIKSVIAQGNLSAMCMRPSDTDNYVKRMDANATACEDPFDAAFSLLSLMFVKAAQDGGRMLLTGLDGEHAIGAPTDYINYFIRWGQWRTSWKEAKCVAGRFYGGGISAKALYFRGLGSVATPDHVRRLKRVLMRSKRYSGLVAESALAKGFARHVNLRARVLEYDQSRYFPGGSSTEMWHQHVMQLPYMTAAIERYERMASSLGVEARHPLLDLRVLSFSSALPLSQKVRDGWSKFMLRRLADSRLPNSVAWRQDKTQIGWLFNARRSEIAIADHQFPITGMKSLLNDFLDPTRLDRLWSCCIEGDKSSLSEFWDYYQLYQWLRIVGCGSPLVSKH